MDPARVMRDTTRPAAGRRRQAGEEEEGAEEEEEEEEEEKERDRLTVVLSKPSNKQKLGMVLKHAQLMGEKRLKTGAYLAALAGDSLAQEAGLVPKDRLVLVEGLDVRALPFDRIVELIRKATFPLTLVWSRERTAAQVEQLPTGIAATAKAAATDGAASTASSAVTEDWVRATNRGRAASRAARQAEVEGRKEGTDERNVRSNSSSGQQQQQTQRAPMGDPMEAGDHVGKPDLPHRGRDQEQGQERQRRRRKEATAAATGNAIPERRLSSQQHQQHQQHQQKRAMEESNDARARADAGGSGGGGSSNGKGSDRSGDAVAAVEGRMGGDDAIKTERMAEAPEPRRQGEMVGQPRERLGSGEGVAESSSSGGSGGAINSSDVKGQVPQDASASSRNGRSGRGAARAGAQSKGARRGRGGARNSRGRVRGSAASAAAAANAVDAAAAAAAGAGPGDVGMEGVAPPDWLSPLMKTKLGDFEGTRYARSRLKLTMSHEWAKQEYRTGIASSGRLDQSITEMDFIRRRLGGGSLYALLEQESRDYLRVGPFIDADTELLGKRFAEAQANKELPLQAAPSLSAATPVTQKATGKGKDAASATPKAKTAKASGGKAAAIAAAGARGTAAGTAGGGSTTWADRLRDFQIDLPGSTSFGHLEAASAERAGLAASAAGGVVRARGRDDLDVVAVDVRGGVEEDDPLAWDGVGVDPLTVIHHRKHFDVRCREYEALNNASRNDKTNALMGRTHRIHQEHTSIISAKRGTLEGTLQNVRQQLHGREEQLRHVQIDQRSVNPMDAAVVARLNENEAVMRTRVAEKKVQMSMIMDEANKVLQWEQTKELSRREAMNHAAEMHGHGGSFAAGASRERNELMQCLVAQKANIMLLSTFCKLRGPWLAPPEYVQASRPSSAAASTASSKGPEDSSGLKADAEEPSAVTHRAENAVAASRDASASPRSSVNGEIEAGCESNSDSPTNAARGGDARSSSAAAGTVSGAKSGKRPIKLRLLPPSGGEKAKKVTIGDDEPSPRSADSSTGPASVAAVIATGGEGDADGSDCVAMTDAEVSMAGPAAIESAGRGGKEEGGGGGDDPLLEAGDLSPVVPPAASAAPPADVSSKEMSAAVPPSLQSTTAANAHGSGAGGCSEGEDRASDVEMVDEVGEGVDDGMDVDTEVDQGQAGTVEDAETTAA